MQVYRDAQRYDAVYSAARQTLAAGRERLPQGRALLLPTLNLTANAQRARDESDSRDPSLTPSFNRDPRTLGYTVTFAQPLYRAAELAPVQAIRASRCCRRRRPSARPSQDLIVRAAQAYFDVLAAQDTLVLVRAQKAAISEQLAQAKRNFEVGTATITDTHEAQSRYDLIAPRRSPR